MDLDWTSEAVIEKALDLFMELDIPCVVFQTHLSETLLKNNSKLFDLEWHPNFYPDSDHGGSVSEVFDHMRHLPLKGVALRAHKYYMPEKALSFLDDCTFRYTMNQYTDLTYQKPTEVSPDIIELNTFFEDGFYVKRKYPFEVDFVLGKMNHSGIFVFNVHPIHIAFNSKCYSHTRTLKDEMSKKSYRTISSEFIAEHKNGGYGMSDFLRDLISALIDRGDKILGLEEVRL